MYLQERICSLYQFHGHFKSILRCFIRLCVVFLSAYFNFLHDVKLCVSCGRAEQGKPTAAAASVEFQTRISRGIKGKIKTSRLTSRNTERLHRPAWMARDATNAAVAGLSGVGPAPLQYLPWSPLTCSAGALVE